eukprot:jgi/Chlat1/3728/Chrsp259S03876
MAQCATGTNISPVRHAQSWTDGTLRRRRAPLLHRRPQPIAATASSASSSFAFAATRRDARQDGKKKRPTDPADMNFFQKCAAVYDIFFPKDNVHGDYNDEYTTPRSVGRDRLTMTLTCDRFGLSEQDVLELGEKVRKAVERFVELAEGDAAELVPAEVKLSTLLRNKVYTAKLQMEADAAAAESNPFQSSWGEVMPVTGLEERSRDFPLLDSRFERLESARRANRAFQQVDEQYE